MSVVDNGGPDGTDTVRNVEILDFTDVDVTVAPPAAPAIGAATATNGSATVSFTAPAGLLTGFTVEAVPAARWKHGHRGGASPMQAATKAR